MYFNETEIRKNEAWNMNVFVLIEFNQQQT